MNGPTTARRWPAADRPALLPPAEAGAFPASGWELVAINSKSAYFRHSHIIGELSAPRDQVEILDPAPWIITEGPHAGERFDTEAYTADELAPPTSWEPRTLRQLRAAGVHIGADERSPYDNGSRAEPIAWSRADMRDIARMVGPQVGEELDRFGRVDFEDDASQTIATVYTDRADNGDWRVRVYDHGGNVQVLDETENAPSPTLAFVRDSLPGLTDEQHERIAEAVQWSSIPEALQEIAASIGAYADEAAA